MNPENRVFFFSTLGFIVVAVDCMNLQWQTRAASLIIRKAAVSSASFPSVATPRMLSLFLGLWLVVTLEGRAVVFGFSFFSEFQK